MASRSLLRFAACVFAAPLLLLTGCGLGPAASTGPVSGTLSLRGVVHGGQPPVAGSTIRLYAAGTTGYGSAATSELLRPVVSDANGNFSITGDYTCANANDQLYIVAQGGNPGLSLGTNNAALTMMTLLGSCSAAPSLPFITINEVTTVAAAWALAPFFGADVAHIGTSATNLAGVTNAIANGRQVVDISGGAVATLPSTLTTEPGKIYSLADSISGCINSNGGSACSALFALATPPNGTAPTDTFAAAINIVRNPGRNVVAVFNLAPSVSPFPGLSTSPHDWTLSLAVSGNGLSQPTFAAVDASGNVWVTNYNSPLSEFAPQGAAIGNFGYGGFAESVGLVIDSNSTPWITQQENPSHGATRGSLAHYNASGALIGYAYNTGIDYPVAAGADPFGNIFVANFGNSTVTIWNNNGTVYPFTTTGGSGNTVNSDTTSVGGNSVAFPVAIAPDASGTASFPGGFWTANEGSTTLTHLDAKGNVISAVDCCNAPNGIAIDSAGNAWSGSLYNSVLTQAAPTGNTYTNYGGRVNCTSGPCNGGLYYPAGVAIDGNQDVWVANYRGSSFSAFAGIVHHDAGGGAVSAGVPLTPESTYDGSGNVIKQGGLGLDANLLLPANIAVDASGNLWVPNTANNNLIMFFGLATPLKTPILPVPVRP